jgi:N-acetylglutamate synthase-like GNAT family acetyltransferase
MCKNDVEIKMRGGRSKIKGIDDIEGDITIFKSGEKVGEAGFIITNYQISVDTITIEDKFIRLGYGKLLVNLLKGLSRLLSKPIVLYSLKESYEFYASMGFTKLKKIHNEKKKLVIVMFKSKNEPKIEDLDLIWLPESLRRKRELRVEL